MTIAAMKGPPGQKVGRAPSDPEWLRDVRSLPCIICQEYCEPQLSPTAAHHPICERYSNEKVPDREAIPLCEGHHQGLLDTSKIAIHQHRALWVETYGSDRSWIARTQDVIERMRANRI